jgi:glycosyltransferase involved in cell wall biosynthesis
MGDPIRLIRNRPSKETVAKDDRQDVRVRLKSWIQKRGALFTLRMPDSTDLWFLTNMFRFVLWVRKQRPDVVVASFGPYSTLMFGLLAKAACRSVFLVSDFRDLWVQHFYFKGFFPLILLEQFLEQIVLRSSDALTSVSTEHLNILKVSARGHRHRSQHAWLVRNGYEESLFSEMASRTSDHSSIVFFYAGTIYQGKRDPTQFYKAVFCNVERHVSADIRIRIASALPGDALQLARREGVEEYVDFLGHISHDEAIKEMMNADVLLLFETPSHTMKGFLTAKIYEYLRAGRAIWAFGVDPNSELARLVRRHPESRVFPENSVDMVDESIDSLRNISRELEVLNKNSTAIEERSIREFERSWIGNRFWSEIEDAVRG